MKIIIVSSLARVVILIVLEKDDVDKLPCWSHKGTFYVQRA
jgi:hypothetical protein